MPRAIEANPPRARLASRAEEYPWSSCRLHGVGEADEWVDRSIAYEELSPYPIIRRRKWAEKVHLAREEATLAQIRRSTDSGLSSEDEAWVKRLARKLNLDPTIRPRGRPRKRAAT
ncbi:MAG: hypothetical protein IT427_06275 [Pirellulales bacterium]|nr:hypothetical protein [Pirellulales bacterium]